MHSTEKFSNLLKCILSCSFDFRLVRMVETVCGWYNIKQFLFSHFAASATLVCALPWCCEVREQPSSTRTSQSSQKVEAKKLSTDFDINSSLTPPFTPLLHESKWNRLNSSHSLNIFYFSHIVCIFINHSSAVPVWVGSSESFAENALCTDIIGTTEKVSCFNYSFTKQRTEDETRIRFISRKVVVWTELSGGNEKMQLHGNM